MFVNRNALIISALMLAASIGAVIARPTVMVADETPIVLEKIVPLQFGDWREEPQRQVQVVNPQAQEMLDKIYSQILSRTYVNSAGYRIMVSLAYGQDQRGSMKAHRPEVCYPAQGFQISSVELGVLTTDFGTIPVRRLFGTLGPREEPVTYWFTIGDKAAVSALQKRIVELQFGLTGRIPDGMLFRVSSIDGDQSRAYRIQEQFVNQLMQSVAPAERKRLSGLVEADKG